MMLLDAANHWYSPGQPGYGTAHAEELARMIAAGRAADVAEKAAAAAAAVKAARDAVIARAAPAGPGAAGAAAAQALVAGAAAQAADMPLCLVVSLVEGMAYLLQEFGCSLSPPFFSSDEQPDAEGAAAEGAAPALASWRQETEIAVDEVVLSRLACLSLFKRCLTSQWNYSNLFEQERLTVTRGGRKTTRTVASVPALCLLRTVEIIGTVQAAAEENGMQLSTAEQTAMESLSVEDVSKLLSSHLARNTLLSAADKGTCMALLAEENGGLRFCTNPSKQSRNCPNGRCGRSSHCIAPCCVLIAHPTDHAALALAERTRRRPPAAAAAAAAAAANAFDETAPFKGRAAKTWHPDGFAANLDARELEIIQRYAKQLHMPESVNEPVFQSLVVSDLSPIYEDDSVASSGPLLSAFLSRLSECFTLLPKQTLLFDDTFLKSLHNGAVFDDLKELAQSGRHSEVDITAAKRWVMAYNNVSVDWKSWLFIVLVPERRIAFIFDPANGQASAASSIEICDLAVRLRKQRIQDSTHTLFQAAAGSFFDHLHGAAGAAWEVIIRTDFPPLHRSGRPSVIRYGDSFFHMLWMIAYFVNNMELGVNTTAESHMRRFRKMTLLAIVQGFNTVFTVPVPAAEAAAAAVVVEEEAGPVLHVAKVGRKRKAAPADAAPPALAPATAATAAAAAPAADPLVRECWRCHWPLTQGIAGEDDARSCNRPDDECKQCTGPGSGCKRAECVENARRNAEAAAVAAAEEEKADAKKKAERQAAKAMK